MAAILEAKDLCRQFGTGKNVVRAVKNVSIAIPAGQLTVLRGPSGSGKTTLLNMLSTLDLPTSGASRCGSGTLSGGGNRPLFSRRWR